MRQASAVNVIAQSNAERLPVFRKASARASTRTVNRMNGISESAAVAMRDSGTESATARHAHTTRGRDSRRLTIQRPATRMVSPKATAPSGPATSYGSATPSPPPASNSG